MPFVIGARLYELAQTLHTCAETLNEAANRAYGAVTTLHGLAKTPHRNRAASSRRAEVMRDISETVTHAPQGA